MKPTRRGAKRPPTIPLRPSDVDAAHLARFEAKIDRSGDCHLWTAATNNAGYGVFRLNGRQVYAHRVAWVIANGEELPTELTIDHVCRNRRCVLHIEPVTSGENTRRQPDYAGDRTHCPQGHPYAGSNLYRFPDGRRACRTCVRAAQARYAERNKSR